MTDSEDEAKARRADPEEPGPPPRERAEPLPGEKPKPPEEDPDAAIRVGRILASPSYVRADEDAAFLARPDLRAVRLQLEYFKPELMLAEAGVRSTIVVFGSTRIPEPAAARRRLAEADAALARAPDDPEADRRARVARRIVAKSHYYDVAREFGRLVSRACQRNHECDFVVMTGGGPGVMEAANRGAFDAAGKSVGLNITLPHEQYPNPYITPELCFQFRYFALRKMHFLGRAKALVAFPGGYGTFDELFETLCLIQTRKIEPLPVVLVGRDFWSRAFDANYLAEEGVIDPEDLSIFTYAETAREIWDRIAAHYGFAEPTPSS